MFFFIIKNKLDASEVQSMLYKSTIPQKQNTFLPKVLENIDMRKHKSSKQPEPMMVNFSHPYLPTILPLKPRIKSLK